MKPYPHRIAVESLLYPGVGRDKTMNPPEKLLNPYFTRGGWGKDIETKTMVGARTATVSTSTVSCFCQTKC